MTLREAFVVFGLDPERPRDAELVLEAVDGYLEAHTVQGQLLLDADRPLHVVSGIMGAECFDLTMPGRLPR